MANTQNPSLPEDAAGKGRGNFILLTVVIFAAYLIFGLSENVKGPAIPRIQADLDINEFQIGLLLAVNALGYLIACSFTAPLARRIGLKPALMISLFVIALSGVTICFAPSYLMLALSFFIMYLANGMLEIALGILAAGFFTERTGTMLNIAHFFYGGGSIIGPIASAGLMAVTVHNAQLGWRYMYMIVLACALLPLIPALFGHIHGRDNEKIKGEYNAYLRDKNLWCVIIILSFGGMAEMGIGGWLVNYMEKANGFGTKEAAFALTAFFAVFTLTRLVIGPLIDKLGFIKSLLLLCGFASVTLILGILCGGRPGEVLIVLSGIGIAPLYPTVFAVVAKLYHEKIDTAMTVTLTAMGIISMISNLLLGFVIDGARRLFTDLYGSAGLGMGYTAGMLFLALCIVAAFAA
ncbi:MAG: MFS transporter, partial [Clostridiales Family XIII bacterium]|nr:MFS transporter [Clostridiales Family XIII bacterium]